MFFLSMVYRSPGGTEIKGRRQQHVTAGESSTSARTQLHEEARDRPRPLVTLGGASGQGGGGRRRTWMRRGQTTTCEVSYGEGDRGARGRGRQLRRTAVACRGKRRTTAWHPGADARGREAPMVAAAASRPRSRWGEGVGRGRDVERD